MSRCDLDLRPFDLKLLRQFGCHAFKLHTEFERNRITNVGRPNKCYIKETAHKNTEQKQTWWCGGRLGDLVSGKK